MEKEMGYIVAQGPEELEHVLNELLEKAKVDSTIKAKAQFILFELGSQKSMIKVDLSEWPIMFWHYDLLGRPATSTVKDILARFAWEKCGEKEWYFREKGVTEAYYKDEEANSLNAFTDWRQQVFEVKHNRE